MHGWRAGATAPKRGCTTMYLKSHVLILRAEEAQKSRIAFWGENKRQRQDQRREQGLKHPGSLCLEKKNACGRIRGGKRA